MPQWLLKVTVSVVTKLILTGGSLLVEWLEEKLKEGKIKDEAKKGIKDVKKIKDRKERAKAMDDYLSFMHANRPDRLRPRQD